MDRAEVRNIFHIGGSGARSKRVPKDGMMGGSVEAEAGVVMGTRRWEHGRREE